MKKTIRRSVTFFLAIAMIACMVVPAFAEPRASDYLSSYEASIYSPGDAKVEVWFEVSAVGYMDEIGALTVMLYESTNGKDWTQVETFRHTDYPDMLGSDTFLYGSHVSYDGVSGRYYKATVTLWAGKDGGGDSRYYSIPSQRVW